MCDSRNVLIIEDDEEMCWELDNIFTNEGYNVWAVTTGGEALSRIERNNFDLIIMDYKLPDMTGERLLKFIQTANLNINTIVISAYGTPQLKREILAIGAVAFVDKPFKVENLMKMSRSALETQ